jgi:hypothetical protein
VGSGARCSWNGLTVSWQQLLATQFSRSVKICKVVFVYVFSGMGAADQSRTNAAPHVTDAQSSDVIPFK